MKKKTYSTPQIRSVGVKGGTSIARVARCLIDGRWHTGDELAKLQHRFSASLLKLREGKFDGFSWQIDKRQVRAGLWEYCFTARSNEPYVPQSPVCLDCGSKRIKIRDDRK